MSTEAEPHAPPPQADDEAPPLLAPHETWLATVGFVAVLATALAVFSMLKIVNSGGKVLQAAALVLSLVTLAGVAWLATSMRRAVEGDDATTGARP